jgi:hypothetical protein
MGSGTLPIVPTLHAGTREWLDTLSRDNEVKPEKNWFDHSKSDCKIGVRARSSYDKAAEATQLGLK